MFFIKSESKHPWISIKRRDKVIRINTNYTETLRVKSSLKILLTSPVPTYMNESLLLKIVTYLRRNGRAVIT